MNLRKQLSSYIALNNYVEAFRENTSSIVLTDAITNGLTDLQLKGSEVKNKPEVFLDSVVAKGGTEQNGTPTPDTPVDIVSNNGVLKARHQSGLPLGYTLLDYVESSGTQYINTGVVLGQDYTNTNIKLEYDALINNSANWQVCGTVGTDGIYIGVNPSDIIYYGTGFSDTSTGVTNPFVKCKYINDAKNGVIKVTNLSTNTDIVNLTYTPVTKTTVLPMILFGFSRSATAIDANRMSGKMYNAKIYNNNELIRHFIPAKRLSDSVIGMYDTVSGTFFINQGTGEFIAGNPVNDFEVYTDGTVETIESHGKNLFDPTKVLFGYYRNKTTGNKTQDSYNFMSSDDGYIPCLPNTTYTFVGTNKTNGTYSKYNTIYFFDSAKNYLGASPYEVSQPTTGTTPSNCRYLQVRSNPLDNSTPIQDAFAQFNWQLEQGSTPTEYEPYFNGGTATAEMLLKVGNYQDVQEILSGDVTRKIGVKVLDGTETGWDKNSTANYFRIAPSSIGAIANVPMLCSHFKYGVLSKVGNFSNSKAFINFHLDTSVTTTTAGWKEWLASEYAKGTPVIIIYPLNASTTETVSPQKLFKNPVTVTEASIDNLEITTTEAEHTVPTPDYPLDIVCNNGVLKVGPNNGVIVEGTPETVTITGKNLLDINKTSGAGYLNTSGELVLFDNYYCSDYIEIKPSTVYTYTETMKSDELDNYIRFCFYDSNKTFIPPRQGNTPTAEAKTYTYKITSPVNAKYIRISSHSNFVKGQLEEGIRPTKYEEYYQASFAPEDLLKLGDYQDVQSVLDGVVTRNVGIKVLDGTEGWIRYGTGKFSTPLIGSKKQDNQQAPISTHFIGISFNNAPVKDGYVSVFNGSISSTSGTLGINYQATPEVAEFKQWLADQYAAGTPVIVVYPLADTVEETVESRDVFITSGTNTIERNSEYVSSDGMTVKYKKLR